MTPSELLGSTEVFSSLPAAHIAQIAARLERREFPRGTDLVVQGGPGDALFIIEFGKVGVFMRDEQFGLDIEVAQLGPGDCVGEMALITGAQRSATVTALANTLAHRLDRTVFDAILAQSPKVQHDLMKVLAKRLQVVSGRQSVPFISLAKYEPDPQLCALVPEAVIRRHSMVPVAFEDGGVTVAAVDPSNVNGLDELRKLLQGMRLRPAAASREDFDRFVERVVAVPSARASIIKTREQSIRFIMDGDEAPAATGGVSGAEILQLVNQIIAHGIEIGASDIHIEPSREGTRVRFRVHGALEVRPGTIPAEAHKPLISRFKVLAKLDITETRKPQDGRISLDMGGRSVDLRLSLIPTKLGQKLVARILDAGSALVALEKLVVAEKVRAAVRKMFYAPHGVVLVTGSTGSGKTTTMYSALLERRNPEINIVTVEDPVEFHLDGVNQVEIGPTLGLDFAVVLKSLLRQDPDIIMVGETRDLETARVALQAGMTGRLVFTSFHTNDCVSAVVRLLEMGVEPFLLANSLVGVIHQHLVRRICPHCKAPFEYFPQIVENLKTAGVIGSTVPTLYRAKGCDRCQNAGYLGRLAAFEILVVTDPVRAAIARQAAPVEILGAASQGAFVPLSRYLGFLLQHGLTAPGEVLGALPRRGT
jgi:type IV pilus assembly protein PilB